MFLSMFLSVALKAEEKQGYAGYSRQNPPHIMAMGVFGAPNSTEKLD
jgi:hypothetical protein